MAMSAPMQNQPIIQPWNCTSTQNYDHENGRMKKQIHQEAKKD